MPQILLGRHFSGTRLILATQPHQFKCHGRERAREPVTLPAYAEVLRRGLLAPPRVLGGVLAGAAVWLEEEKRRER